VHGRILLLNGPPSSGKTTLARAIQAAAEQPLWHQSLDDFRAGYSKRFWRVDDGSLFALAMYAYLRALRSIAEAGVDLVAESVITPTRRSMYLGVFDGFSVTFVGVRCTLPVAQAREHARTDRLRGPVDLDVPEFEQCTSTPTTWKSTRRSRAPRARLSRCLKRSRRSGSHELSMRCATGTHSEGGRFFEAKEHLSLPGDTGTLTVANES